MSARVPGSLVAFWAIVTSEQSKSTPVEVLHLAEKIRLWVAAKNARTAMNRAFATLRTRSPQKIIAIILWLEQPSVGNLFSRYGAFGMRAELHTALNSIIDSKKAHVAFGQNKNVGRPPVPGFSRAFDAAIYAEYKIRNENLTTDDAIFNASEVFEARKELVAKLQASLATFGDFDIQEMYFVSCRKHGITI